MKKNILRYAKAILRVLTGRYCRVKGYVYYLLIKYNFCGSNIKNLNLAGGTVSLKGYFNIDLYIGADLCLDLGKNLLPFSNNSIQSIVCMSSINYFTKERGQKIISEVYRVLRSGGVTRFGTQDLKSIAEKYVNNDKNFFFQKLANGQERFVGETICDKINSWFYGYAVARGQGCKYFYDYETLAKMFIRAGFFKVERRSFQDSQLPHRTEIDNRPGEMFFLEAVK